jgi:transposase
VKAAKEKNRKGAAAMKNQAIKYLALDVHQATIVASARDESGAIMLRATVRTEAKAIVNLVRALGPRVHVVFEEGTQAQWLHDLLQPVAERVVVCNVRGCKGTGNKNDRVDGDRLSDDLRTGRLKTVYHGASSSVLTLKELVRNYINLVEDSTRVMLRIKALFRARAIATAGKTVYSAQRRSQWLVLLKASGARQRAESLFAQLDNLLPLRRQAKASMMAEARRHPAWKILRSIPFLGPVRVAKIIAIVGSPHRFRGKRRFWPYIGLAVRTYSSADNEIVGKTIRRRRRPPLTRGLNQNYNRVLKDVFKGAANAAASSDGPLKDSYERSLARGVDEDLAKLTLTRKIAAVALRLWKKGELFDPTKLTTQTI